MSDWNGFRGAAKRIEDRDLPRIGATIGVGEDEIHAFMDVEAAGSGFDGQGRPKMLFEPHVFYKHLSGGKRAEAVRQGLAYAKWKPGKYPRDSYPRLEKAMAIDETAALKSASWGLGQILGENHKMVGYDTAQAMVRAFMEDEEAHLQAIVDFLVSSGIDDDLKAHRWEAVARGYNGPSHAKHNYAGRMKAAYAKWSGIKDTPMPAAKPLSRFLPKPKPERAPDIVEQDISIRRVQESLRTLGYPEVGFVDGKMGDRTKAAIAAFQINEGLEPTGELTSELLTQIMQAHPRKVSPTRKNLQVKDISDSPGVKIGNFLKVIGSIAGAFGVGGGALDAFTEDSGRVGQTIDNTIATVDRVNGVVNTIFDVGPWIGLGFLGLFAAYAGWLVIQHLLQGSREGRHV